MVFVVVVALLASALTFFSGFGLGTLLLPAFALFLPLELAIACTAIVHLAHNIFKFFFAGKHADWKTCALFAVPAAVFAFLGAALLNQMSAHANAWEYALLGRTFVTTTDRLVIAAIMLVFAVLELNGLKKWKIEKPWLPFGGAISGFFGGLSGHQGAFRSVFLMCSGLDQKAFVGTSVVCAIAVDLTRLMVYGSTFFSKHLQLLEAQGQLSWIYAGVIAAFLGNFIGARFLGKITIDAVRKIVAVMVIGIAVGLALGLI